MLQRAIEPSESLDLRASRMARDVEQSHPSSGARFADGSGLPEASYGLSRASRELTRCGRSEAFFVTVRTTSRTDETTSRTMCPLPGLAVACLVVVPGRWGDANLR